MPARKMRSTHLRAVPSSQTAPQAVRQGRLSAEEKFALVFDHASDAIVTFQGDLSVDAMNRAAEEMTGFLRGDVQGRAVELLIPAGKIPARMRKFEPHLLEAEGTYEDVVVARQDGGYFIVDMSVSIVHRGDDAGEAKQVVIAILHDVTEKKRMERELITKHSELRDAFVELEKKNSELKATQETLVQAGKMAALGELAAGIAHELNQPLMAIRGYAQELQYGFEKPERTDSSAAVASLNEIISGADKMAAIISHLRTFTRRSTEDFEMTDLHHPIEEALKMVSRQLQSRGIEVVRNFAKDLPPIYANSLQLEQIFINLTTNARDAIEATGRGRGKITITTKKSGRFSEVRFQDDGCGMDDRTLTKAFNPFFTTKEVGKGMGLGLSLSYGMISKIHGSVRVESEMGRGTTFIIQLPTDFRELG